MSDEDASLGPLSRWLIKAWLVCLGVTVVAVMLGFWHAWLWVAVALPILPLVLLSLAIPASTLLDRARSRSLASRVEHCPSCGYVVEGLPTSICPECGADWRTGKAGAAPVVVVEAEDAEPRRLDRKDRIAEWRMVRTGVRRLAWCSSIAAGLAWYTMRIDSWPILVFFLLLGHAVATWAALFVLRRRWYTERGVHFRPGQQVPKADTALAAVIAGWVAWAVLALAWCDSVGSG